MARLIFAFLILLPSILEGQITLLNDEFNQSASLSNWNNINTTEGWDAEHLEILDIDNSAPDQLTLSPYTSSWYENYRGTLLFKNVSGDFVFTTEVTATNRLGNGLPNSDYSLAGAMLRTPRPITNGAADWTPGGENYIFLSIGQASDFHPSLPSVPTPGPHFEVKTTVNSVSTLRVTGISTAEQVQIRIARLGDYIICLYRIPGTNWVVHERYHRPDFPDELQMGMVAYTDWDKVSTYDPLFHNSHVLNASLNPDPSSNPGLDFQPDLIGRFEFARFSEVTLPGPLVDLDLTSAVVSDADLLAFLGFESVAATNTQEIEELEWHVFPNPTRNTLRLEGLNANSVAACQIFDFNGRPVIIDLQLEEGKGDVSALPNGVYLMRIHLNDGRILNKKFIKLN